jgi:membrane protein insertase Oxa1/YidC/SpoIIIJ
MLARTVARGCFALLVLNLLLLALFLLAPPARAQDWLRGKQVPADKVTDELNALWAMETGAAAKQAERWQQAAKGASDEGKLAAALLNAVALERAGQPHNARSAYETLTGKGDKTPYGTSAAMRLKLMDQSTEEQTKIFREVGDEQGEEAQQEGWFLVGKKWERTTRQRAALSSLVEARSDQLLMRGFQYLRQQSPFPPALHFLFILIVITLAARVLTLPLTVRTARFTRAVQKLKPEIEHIQARCSTDFVRFQQEMAELYARNNLSVTSGCLLGLVDLIFIIVALVTLSGFSPQMRLDGASLWWMSDVTRFDLPIAIIWIVMGFLQLLIFGSAGMPKQTISQILSGSVFFSLIILAIAWYWEWPAYVFIFWLLLGIAGILFNRIVMLVLAIFSPRSPSGYTPLSRAERFKFQGDSHDPF